MTFTDAEGSDDDRDRLAAAMHTETRAAGERPDAASWAVREASEGAAQPDKPSAAWAYTETKATGEPYDHAAEPWVTTTTKADGEHHD